MSSIESIRTERLKIPSRSALIGTPITSTNFSVSIKATIKGNKGAKIAVKFTAKSGNIKATTTKKVKVK